MKAGCVQQAATSDCATAATATCVQWFHHVSFRQQSYLLQVLLLCWAAVTGAVDPANGADDGAVIAVVVVAVVVSASAWYGLRLSFFHRLHPDDGGGAREQIVYLWCTGATFKGIGRVDIHLTTPHRRPSPSTHTHTRTHSKAKTLRNTRRCQWRVLFWQESVSVRPRTCVSTMGFCLAPTRTLKVNTPASVETRCLRKEMLTASLLPYRAVN